MAKNTTSKLIILFGLIYFIFQFIDPLLPVETSDRTIPLLLQGVLVAIGLVFFIKYIFDKNNNKAGTKLLLFTLFIGIYAVFSTNFLAQYPMMLMSVTAFFIFYSGTRNNLVNIDKYYNFFYILLFYFMYLMIVQKDSMQLELGSAFQNADNKGYFVSMLAIVFLLKRDKIINVVMFVVAILLTFYSMKKGAILCSSVTLLLFFRELMLSPKYKMNYKIIISLIFIIALFVGAGYWEYVVARFDNIESSGREGIYTTVYNGWANAPIVNQLFGYGYYACLVLLNGLYAHSDFFEILYDEGIFGLLFYLVVLMSFLFQYSKVKKYTPQYAIIYLSLLATWFIGATISGVIIGKGSVILFAMIGYILGSVDKNRSLFKF